MTISAAVARVSELEQMRGAKYRRQQLDRFGGDVARALAAYSAGPGVVDR